MRICIMSMWFEQCSRKMQLVFFCCARCKRSLFFVCVLNSWRWMCCTRFNIFMASSKLTLGNRLDKLVQVWLIWAHAKDKSNANVCKSRLNLSHIIRLHTFWCVKRSHRKIVSFFCFCFVRLLLFVFAFAAVLHSLGVCISRAATSYI